MTGIDINRLPDLIEKAEAALGAGWSLPYEWMGDPDLHQFEMTAVHERNWQAVASTSDLRKVGSHIVRRLGRIPVLVVCDRNGSLNGFVNVCRHRGYPVASHDGCAGQLTCRYHGWVYELDGRLRMAPGAEDLNEFDHDGLALERVRVECWRGVVFANADPDALSIADTYPNLERTAEAAGFDLTTYTFHAIETIDIACDWKLLFDNVTECYHCPGMHATTLNTLYGASEFEAARWQGGMRHAHALLADTHEVHHSIQLFPGTMLLHDPVMGMVSWFHATGPGTSRFVVHYLAAPGANSDRLDHFVSQWSKTLAEDKQILEMQMDGIRCGRIARGRLVASREPSVPEVQALILKAYRDGLSAAARRG